MAGTNSGGKWYICETPQNSNLTLAQFDDLDWTPIPGLGSHGETGTSQNMPTYDTWDTTVTQKGKGIANAGDPEVELLDIPGDPGHALLLTAADPLNKMNYAFKLEQNDKLTVGGTNSIKYNRGVVTGPRTPNGRNEDFDLRLFTIGCNQVQIIKPAT